MDFENLQRIIVIYRRIILRYATKLSVYYPYNRIFEQGKSTFINFNFPIFPHPLPRSDVINTNVPCNNNNNGDKYLWLGVGG